ncbi:hypothetical protein MLOOGBEN_06715 [Bacillus sp. EB106-08-02-XG196]|uniref:phage tail protein n=1 Tax=Bacillus sp. EB106-08-02-XG196 TaxID=2737049 RepID=UPI0015C481EE|nr:hypothetical protein [Bacillus sp. EB106-08-02-XG196]NWQ40390.1 hypothetical protein [Bacillus sp. EB106-08-02-XG196]
MSNMNLTVQVGANIAGLTSGLRRATQQMTGMSETVRGITRTMSGLSERAQGMARDLQEAFRTPRADMTQYRESQIEISHGYLELARNSDEYAGRTGDLMSALADLGNQQRQLSQSMISNNIAVRTSFLQSIGAVLGASTQSSSIASNLERINNPLYNVNQGLLRVSGGMERMARAGTPAVLALQQLGPQASMAQLQSQIRLINAGIMRMGAVALVAAGASVLLYGGLHKAASAMNPKYAESFTNMIEKLKQAFKPMVDVFAAVMTPLYNFVAKIAEMAIKFNEAHPTLAKMIQGFMMLLPILTLILAPLAVGIGMYGGLAAAMNAVWLVIGPLVIGLSSMMATVMLVAAAIVGFVAAFIYAYKHIEGFRNFIDTTMAAIKSAFDVAFNFVKGIVNSVMAELSLTIKSGLSQIMAWWKQNGEAIMQVVQLYWASISGQIRVALGIITGIFQAVFPVIVGVVKVAWAVIQAVFSTVVNVILGIIGTFAKLFTGDFKGAMEMVKNTASTIWNNIVSIFKSINLAEIGRNIIAGLVSGIKSMASAVTSAVSGIAKAIPAKIKSFLGIHSPSRVLMELGEFSGEGFANGIKNMINEVKGATADMASAAVPSLAYATPSTSGYAGGTAERSLNKAASNSGSQKVTIEIPLYLNGSEIARATYDDINQLMSSDFSMKARMSGMRR